MTGPEPTAETFGGTEATALAGPVISNDVVLDPSKPTHRRLERLRSFRQPTVDEMIEREFLEELVRRKAMA